MKVNNGLLRAAVRNVPAEGGAKPLNVLTYPPGNSASLS